MGDRGLGPPRNLPVSPHMKTQNLLGLGALVATAGVLWMQSDTPAGDLRFTPSNLINEQGENITGNFTEQERRWAVIQRKAGEEFGVPPAILMGNLSAESAGDPTATNTDGERGLHQLRPIAVQDVAENTKLPELEEVPTDALKNSRYAAAFLRLQKDRMGGEWFDALRAYVAGAQGAKNNPQLAAETARKRLRKAGWV